MFKEFCLMFRAKYPDDHRCHWIEEALDDYYFPWSSDCEDIQEYFEDSGACEQCIECFNDVYECYVEEVVPYL